MSNNNTTFILGYHGCSMDVAIDIIFRKKRLKQSKNDYDWLGHGVYFWEGDEQRAFEWANECVTRKKFKNPAVIGAVIDLKNCLDLTTRNDLDLVESTYKAYKKFNDNFNIPTPKNANLSGDINKDLLLRNLDCAVINYLHKTIDDIKVSAPFDTVRGIFPEGSKLYENSGFSKNTNSQVAVKNPDCIIGYFIPKKYTNLFYGINLTP